MTCTDWFFSTFEVRVGLGVYQSFWPLYGKLITQTVQAATPSVAELLALIHMGHRDPCRGDPMPETPPAESDHIIPTCVLWRNDCSEKPPGCCGSLVGGRWVGETAQEYHSPQGRWPPHRAVKSMLLPVSRYNRMLSCCPISPRLTCCRCKKGIALISNVLMWSIDSQTDHVP